MLKGVSSGENKVSHRCEGGEQRNLTTGQPNTSLVGCTIFVQSPFSDLPQSFQFVETDCRAGKKTLVLVTHIVRISGVKEKCRVRNGDDLRGYQCSGVENVY